MRRQKRGLCGSRLKSTSGTASDLDGLAPSAVLEALTCEGYVGGDSEGRVYDSLQDLWEQEAGRRPRVDPTVLTDADISGNEDVTEMEALSVSGKEGERASPATFPAMSNDSDVSGTTAAADLPCTDGKNHAWYSVGRDYWDKTEASVSGVLAGFEAVHSDDVEEAFDFVRSLHSPLRAAGADQKEDTQDGDAMRAGAQMKRKGRMTRAVDVGGGIGRTARGLLRRFFQRVDLVDVCPHFLAKAEELDLEAVAAIIGKEALEEKHENKPEDPTSSMKENSGWVIGTYECSGMHQWTPEAGVYDAIWMQWVVGHLPDDAFVAFLQRCALGLAKGGHIFVKENNTKRKFELDREDGCISRTDCHFRILFARANLVVEDSARQREWPTTLLPVTTYALRKAQEDRPE